MIRTHAARGTIEGNSTKQDNYGTKGNVHPFNGNEPPTEAVFCCREFILTKVRFTY